MIGDNCKLWHSVNLECDECQDGYYLIDENPTKCYEIPNYVTGNCDTHEL